MSYAVVGHCPRCGAPIYAGSPYMSVLPPPNIYSCSCFAAERGTVTTTITTEASNVPGSRVWSEEDEK